MVEQQPPRPQPILIGNVASPSSGPPAQTTSSPPLQAALNHYHQMNQKNHPGSTLSSIGMIFFFAGPFLSAIVLFNALTQGGGQQRTVASLCFGGLGIGSTLILVGYAMSIQSKNDVRDAFNNVMFHAGIHFREPATSSAPGMVMLLGGLFLLFFGLRSGCGIFLVLAGVFYAIIPFSGRLNKEARARALLEAENVLKQSKKKTP